MTGRSLSGELFVLARDCAAVTVPLGDEVILCEGQMGYITQALGGSFTVYADGNLFRIAGNDADALGKEVSPALTLSCLASDEEIEGLVLRQLKTVYDPEIPIDIVELGLIYRLKIVSTDQRRRRIDITMTLTAPGCGMGAILVDDVRAKLKLIPIVEDVNVDLVFEPQWDRSMMSEAAKLECGLL